MERVAIGKILRARGVKGELLIAPLSRDLKRFSRVDKVFISDPDSGEKLYRIKRSRIFQAKVLLQLEGVDTREKAEELEGKYLEIDRKDISPLPDGEYYVFDLINCQVLSLKGKNIGEVKEVLLFPANPVLSVRKGKKEYLIPFIKDVVKKIDLQQRLIYIDPLKGLLD